MRIRGAHVVLFLPLVVSCATSPRPAPAAPTPPPAAEVAAVGDGVTAPSPDETRGELEGAPNSPPSATCSTALEREGCFPQKEYAEYVCDGHDRSLALGMFRPGNSWVRAYVTRNLESWDPARRSRVARSHLVLDEEVVVLRPYRPDGGVMLLGATTARGWTSVDALRADGSCVSLMADEIAMKRPPAPTYAPIAWEKLGERERAALLNSPGLRKRAESVTKACASVEDKRCVQARVQLTEALVGAPAPVAARAAPLPGPAARPTEPATASIPAELMRR